MTNQRDDPRSVSQLIEAACQADDHAADEAIIALHWRGSKDVLDRAIFLTCSQDPNKRGIGANILGQLGVPERTFPAECFAAVLPLLNDKAETVIRDAIHALSFIDDARAASHIILFSDHQNDDVRFAVTFGLCSVETPEARDVLLKLMRDRDADVRNWATFGLGQQSDADSDQIRSALAAALLDDDADVRYEGIIGLGRRRDRRAVPYLKLLLHDDPDDHFAQDATAKLLGLEEGGQTATAELLGALQRLKRFSDRRTDRPVS